MKDIFWQQKVRTAGGYDICVGAAYVVVGVVGKPAGAVEHGIFRENPLRRARTKQDIILPKRGVERTRLGSPGVSPG